MRPCIFQPGNFTGRGSEGVKLILPSILSSLALITITILVDWALNTKLLSVPSDLYNAELSPERPLRGRERYTVTTRMILHWDGL